MTDIELIEFVQKHRLTKKDCVDIAKAWRVLQDCQRKGLTVGDFANVAQAMWRGWTAKEKTL